MLGDDGGRLAQHLCGGRRGDASERPEKREPVDDATFDVVALGLRELTDLALEERAFVGEERLVDAELTEPRDPRVAHGVALRDRIVLVDLQTQALEEELDAEASLGHVGRVSRHSTVRTPGARSGGVWSTAGDPWRSIQRSTQQ